MKGKKALSKALKGANPKWDETELHWYRQFLETGSVEHLAYTAVQEAHLRRKAKEELDEKEKRITSAIKKMCLGLSMLEKELGIDLHKMAMECAEEELNEILGTPEERWGRSARKGKVHYTPLRT